VSPFADRQMPTSSACRSAHQCATTPHPKRSRSSGVDLGRWLDWRLHDQVGAARGHPARVGGPCALDPVARHVTVGTLVGVGVGVGWVGVGLDGLIIGVLW